MDQLRKSNLPEPIKLNSNQKIQSHNDVNKIKVIGDVRLVNRHSTSNSSLHDDTVNNIDGKLANNKQGKSIVYIKYEPKAGEKVVRQPADVYSVTSRTFEVSQKAQPSSQTTLEIGGIRENNDRKVDMTNTSVRTPFETTRANPQRSQYLPQQSEQS